MLEFTEVGMQEAYRMALMISFVQQLKGWIERIDGDALWDCLSFVVMLEAELCMERNRWVWETIEWLRCFPYTLYILIFCLVSLRESAES